MKRIAYVLGVIEYDNKRTKLDELEAAIDNECWPKELLAPGAPVLRKMGLATSECAKFDRAFKMYDWSDSLGRDDTAPLRFQVRVTSTAIAITVLGDFDQELGDVAIDYFDNKLRALIYEPEHDEPDVVHVFTDNTDWARGEPPTSSEAPEED